MNKLLAMTVLIMTLSTALAQAQSCGNPNDRASDGSRCGGRAASERPGGR